MVGLLGRIEDPIRRRLILRRGADVFGLEEAVLLEAVQGRGRGKKGAKTQALVTPGPAAGPVSGTTGEKSVDGCRAAGVSGASEATTAPSDPVERELAGRVLTEEGAFLEVVAQSGATCFNSTALQELLRPWFDMGRRPVDEELRELMARRGAVSEFGGACFVEGICARRGECRAEADQSADRGAGACAGGDA